MRSKPDSSGVADRKLEESRSLITFLGVDPGLRRTGFAVARADVTTGSIVKVIQVGTIETERQNLRHVRKTSDDLRRAQIQAAALRSLIADHQVAVVAMEMSTTTPYTYPTFSFGVMIGISASFDRPIIEVLPHEVKKATTGSVAGTKGEIIAWAIKKSGCRNVGWPTSTRQNQLRITLEGKNVTRSAEHPADALGAIQAALMSNQFMLAAGLFG